MAQLAIKGHAKRGKEIIEILKMLGGKNTYSCNAVEEAHFYFIVDGEIDYDEERYITNKYAVFTLEEFLEKFPYKIGDKVIVKGYKQVFEILSMRWCSERNDIMYSVSNGWFYTEELQPYKKETMEEIKVDIPRGYEFSGVDDNKQQVVFTKIQPQYPKTYWDCAKFINRFAGDKVNGYNYDLILNLQKLLISRDAYWKIAGEQMGLGKPWEPDYKDGCTKYTITIAENKIYTDVSYIFSHVLIFPTEEIRDAFCKNFKELIEKCKELL